MSNHTCPSSARSANQDLVVYGWTSPILDINVVAVWQALVKLAREQIKP